MSSHEYTNSPCLINIRVFAQVFVDDLQIQTQ